MVTSRGWGRKSRGGRGAGGERPLGPREKVSGRLGREGEGKREGNNGRGKLEQGEKQGGVLVQTRTGKQ